MIYWTEIKFKFTFDFFIYSQNWGKVFSTAFLLSIINLIEGWLLLNSEANMPKDIAKRWSKSVSNKIVSDYYFFYCWEWILISVGYITICFWYYSTWTPIFFKFLIVKWILFDYLTLWFSLFDITIFFMFVFFTISLEQQ